MSTPKKPQTSPHLAKLEAVFSKALEASMRMVSRIAPLSSTCIRPLPSNSVCIHTPSNEYHSKFGCTEQS